MSNPTEPTSSPPSTPSTPPAPDRQQPASLSSVRASFVRVAIAASGLLLVVMIALLCYPWLTRRNPSSVLIVQGDWRHEGARVRIAGGILTESYLAILTAENRFAAQFHLEPGRYTIRVEQTDAGDGGVDGKSSNSDVLLDGDMVMPAVPLHRLDLTKLQEAEMPPRR